MSEVICKNCKHYRTMSERGTIPHPVCIGVPSQQKHDWVHGHYTEHYGDCYEINAGGNCEHYTARGERGVAVREQP